MIERAVAMAFAVGGRGSKQPSDPTYQAQTGSARVLITCPTYVPGIRGAGPIRSVSQIIESAPPGINVTLVTRDRDFGDRRPYPELSGRWVNRGRARTLYLNTRKPTQWVRLVRELRREPFTLMYVNSLWDPALSGLPLLLTSLGILKVQRVLIAPRGELSPGALALKARKKRLFLVALRPFLRHIGPTWHASTDLEAAAIVAVFPQAVPRIAISSDQDSFSEPADEPREHARVGFVYVGRISRMKNLLLTIEALARAITPSSLDVYGPIEDRRYWATCKRRIAELPEHVKVSYCGELQPDEVQAAFFRYDAFILPTLGENFGHVIAESLAACCPVICSEHTPWTPVLESGGGQVVYDMTPEAWGAALESWAALSPTDVRAKRRSALQAYLNWSAQQDRTNILALVLGGAGSET